MVQRPVDFDQEPWDLMGVGPSLNGLTLVITTLSLEKYGLYTDVYIYIQVISHGSSL